MQTSVSQALGFVIVSHRSREQLLRLVTALNRHYDNPPIACHHDFSQCNFAIDDFPPNISFVRPSIRTSWATWPVVKASLEALRLLYERSSPEWFVLLSAADYPIMRADEVLRDLMSTGADAFIDYRSIGEGPDSASRWGPGNPELGHFESEGNRRLKWRFYIGAEIWIPILRRIGKGFRIGRYTVRMMVPSWRHPFDETRQCYHGDHWFSANRKAAQILLNPSRWHRAVQRHLKWRAIPDECYYQTVLCNTDLKLERNNKRYAKWNGGGAHPQELTMGELDAALSSGAHFARKFGSDQTILDRIDQALESNELCLSSPQGAWNTEYRR